MNVQKQDQFKILVIDDEAGAQESVGSILKEKGYMVQATAGGRGCLDCVRQERFDLIVADLTKPDSDGVEVYRLLNAEPTLASIPVIFMISDPKSRALETVCGSAVSDFILTPVNRQELLTRIALLLKMKPAMEKTTEVEKYQSVLQTAGGVCHSLNQPLQYVLGAVQILLMDMSPDDKMFMSLDTIREKVEQMGIMTRRLAEVTGCRPKL